MSRFGELEATVMDRLWTADSSLSVREVLEDLQHERTIACTTVMTVLERLFRKQMLTRVADRVSPREATQLLQALAERKTRRGR